MLNEKPPQTMPLVELPKCHRKHPDIRIARRATTITSLARVISERKVSRGLRQTLITQARRLERLAEERLKDFSKDETDTTEK